jgi:hypothetical protein
MKEPLTYVASWGVGIAVAAAVWSRHRWWVAILIGLACGLLVFVLVTWRVARDKR